METLIEAAGADWRFFKTAVEVALRVHPDVLHVIVGFAIYIAAAVFLRVSLRATSPLLILIFALLLNEINDFRFSEIRPLWVGDTLRDTVLTLLLPLTVCVTSRLFPGLLLRKDSAVIGEPEV